MKTINNRIFEYAEELSLLNILRDSKKITEEEYRELLNSIERDYKVTMPIEKST